MGKHQAKSLKHGSASPKPSLAERADLHALYEEAVQCAEAEIDFVDQTFTAVRGRTATRLREDFCGTANVCCEWIRRRAQNYAIGVDIDPSVQGWGRQHHVAKLSTEQVSRLTLLEDDVRTVRTEPVDIVLAMNFSYWCFKERSVLRDYFSGVRNALVDDGIMFLDAFGGYEAFRLLEEETEYDDFTYVWDQASYNPINGDYICNIHFTFPDGSEIRDAFTYEWHLWTLPEIRELLLEAGFSRVTVYWDFSDEDDEEEEYVPAERGEPDAGWVCYIVAEK